MDTDTLKVLLIEDSPVQRRLIQKQLETASSSSSTSSSIDLESRDNLTEGLERLSRGGIDVVLLDLLLPDSSGMETLWKVLAQTPDLPIVVLTSLNDEELAVQAVKRGAQDYLGKEQITGDILVRSLRHAVERKKLQGRLERYARDLERHHYDLSQFSIVAVDRLRSLLEEATGAFDLLLGESGNNLDRTARDRIHRALDGIEQMRRLLEDFRIYTRLAGESEATTEPVDCEEVLNEVREALRGEIDESGLDLVHETLPRVAMRRRELFYLFRHLIDNAIRFRGEDPVRVEIGARRDADAWLFSFRDNGQGIDPDYPGQIFEPFQTLGYTPGTGIGLAVCERIVEKRGGRIWVESRPGAGSTFFFTIPVTPGGEGGRRS